MYVLFILYGAGRKNFDAGNIHHKGHWKGGGPENRDFFGPEKAMIEASSMLGKLIYETK